MLMLGVVGAFAGSIEGDYVWDDRFLIRDNAQNLRLEKVGWLFSRDVFASSTPPRSSSAYRPLVMLSYAVDRTLLGHQARWYHASNLFWHLVAVTLLFLLVLRWTGSGVAALVSGMILGIHPSQTEAVAWLSGRQDLFPAVWTLAALLLNGIDRPAWLRLTMVPLAAFAAFLSKENAIVVPLLVVAADHWIHKRAWNDRTCWAKYGLLAAVVLLYFVLRGHAGLGSGTPRSFGELWQLLSDFTGLSSALLKIFIYPVYSGPLMVYQRPGILPVAGSLSLVLLVIVLFLYRWRLTGITDPGRRMALGMLWFGLAVAPAALALSATEVVAERYLYLPCAGLALLCGQAAQLFARMTLRHFKPRQTLLILGVPFLIMSAMNGVLVAQQVHNWRSDRALFRSILTAQPFNAVAASQLGRDHLLRGEARNALYWFERVFRCKRIPGYIRSRTLNYATVALLRIKHYPAAIGVGIASIKYTRSPNNHYNLGLAYYNLAQQRKAARPALLQKALGQFLATVKLAPYHDRARLFAAQCHEQSGRPMAAFKLLLVARRNSPYAPQVQAAIARLRKKIDGE